MTSIRTARGIASTLALVVAWCLLWRSFSIANIVAGLGISLGLSVLGFGAPGRGAVRLVPLLKLVGLVLVDLVKSTLVVAQEVLTHIDSTDESIISVDLPLESREHFLLLVVAVTLTPGTAVVDTDQDTSILFLHLLHDERREETIAHVEQLAALACEAFPLSHRKSVDAS